MLQRKQLMRGKEHYSPKCIIRPLVSLFHATTRQATETSPRDPGVVSLCKRGLFFDHSEVG